MAAGENNQRENERKWWLANHLAWRKRNVAGSISVKSVSASSKWRNNQPAKIMALNGARKRISYQKAESENISSSIIKMKI